MNFARMTALAVVSAFGSGVEALVHGFREFAEQFIQDLAHPRRI